MNQAAVNPAMNKILEEKIIIYDFLKSQKNVITKKRKVSLVVMYEAEIYFIIDDDTKVGINHL